MALPQIARMLGVTTVAVAWCHVIIRKDREMQERKCKKQDGSNGIYGIIARVVAAIVVCGGILVFCGGRGMLEAVLADTSDYTWTDVDCGCCDRTVSVGEYTGTDYDQGSTAQDAAWETFKTDYPGLVDGDRCDNQTWVYNCHAYIFYGTDRWLDDPSNYLDESDTVGCWKEDDSGTIKHDSGHSCEVTDNKGKCGRKFLCKNNQHVYTSMPTQKYSENEEE